MPSNLHNKLMASFLCSTSRIPVLYIFGKEAMDMQACVAAFRSIYHDKLSHIIIMYDVTYSHVTGEFMPLE